MRTQTNFLFDPPAMSNEHLGATLIVNERDVYYNRGPAQGSEMAGQGPAWISDGVQPQKLFRGVIAPSAWTARTASRRASGRCCSIRP
jgi:hypothetical protein